MHRLIGFTQSAFDPASRFRFIQFIPHFQKCGWDVLHRPNVPDRQWKSSLRWRPVRAIHYRLGRALMKANRWRDLILSRHYTAAFVNRDFAAEGSIGQKMFVPLLRRAVFDFDDAIFVGAREKLVRSMCQNAFWVTAGNQYLAEYANRFSDRVTVVPTVIDTDVYIPRDYSLISNPPLPRIGWSGSDQSIRTTLLPHLPMLESLQAKSKFELVVITNSRPDLPTTSLRWKFVPWKAEGEANLQNEFDIGIMPLVDDAFQKGKCALKLLQYMAAGLPTVASPVGVNSEVVLHGKTGLLARNETEWHEGLRCLLNNAEIRRAMGEAGRNRCEMHYSVQRWSPVLLELFGRIAESQRGSHS